MFTKLRTKLTFLYAGLFGLISIVIAATVYVAASNNAAQVVRSELESNGQVFDRIWQLRADQLRDSADLLSRDFGFRDAIASADKPTIISALDNLRQRLKLDRAFFLDNNGEITGGTQMDPAQREALWRALDSAPRASGILLIDGAPYQAISAPVLAPDTLGWVVFAAALNEKQMHAFEQLAAIPITTHIFTRAADATWQARGQSLGEDSAMLSSLLSKKARGAQAVKLRAGDAIALALPLASLTAGDGKNTALVLSYPMAKALAPYNMLMLLMSGVGLFGLALVLFGSWALANSLTKPISALDDAAQRLQQGEDIQVNVQSDDEIGRLAKSFNTMATEIKRREQRIRHMAQHDSESKLRNRRGFENALSKRLQTPGEFVVAAIGIDRFQHVRGAIGYELAGRMIREIGERLALMEPKISAARLSADTLGIMLNGADEARAINFAHLIQRTIDAPMNIDGVNVDIASTIGLIFAKQTDDAATLINHASVAIEQARDAHTKAAIFDALAYGDPSRNLSLISELYKGIKNGEAFLVHQPKFDIKQRRITGVEVLMRWRHPERGLVSPDLFITMAEETGNIRGLTEWVLARAIADQKEMRAEGHDVTVSVNISGKLLSDSVFASKALRMIEDAKASICFEITETAVINNPDAALSTLDRCAAAGVKISIDDYGSGLSSLSYLKQIRAQELKIDKSFIMSAADSKRDALLVKSTIDLAHSLGMQVAAEGVETKETLALLANMGCDLVQGYLIGRPAPLADFLSLLARMRPKPAETLAASAA